MKRRRTLARRYARTAYLLLAPALIFFALMFYLPIGNMLATSTRTGAQADEFVGLGNYVKALGDPAVGNSFLLTLLFSVGVVAGSIVIGLALALALNQPLKGRTLLRAALLVPYLTSVAIVGLLWKNILDPNLGILNRALLAFDLEPQNWLAESPLLTITAVTLWMHTGYVMVIFLAGLQGIPETYHEAARIDGANAWHRFWKITLPLLAPATLFVSVISVIESLKAFAQAYIITGGGPGDATDLLVYHVYKVAFNYRDFGYASAQAVLLLLVIIFFTVLQLRAGRRGEVTY